MELFNSLFNWIMARRMGQIEHFMRHPHQVQEDLLTNLVSIARHTEWGKTHGYNDIANYEQFARNVPVSSYEDIYPYIERVLKGEEKILWPTEIKWFSKSSGTTNARSKFIPMSRESLEECHYKAGKDMLSLYVNRYPETKMFMGKSLAIGGSLQTNPFNSKTVCGDVSALIMKNLPIWAEYMRAPDLETALMSEWEPKIAKMANITAKENITTMAGVPTWTLVLLERILEMTGKKNIKEVWPNLEMFAHGAVAFGPYRDTFQKLAPDMRYTEIYNASEGFFGLQDTNEPDEMLLMLDYGVFYEFIPMEEWDQPQPKCIPLHQVTAGKNYAMVISTNAGLWRYKIGDTLRFTSTSPYRIKITGRTKHFINAFGEEVIIENAEEAITEASRATGAKTSNFTAGPVYLAQGKKGGHEWIIEFDEPPENLEEFARVLDQHLKQINSDYDAKRTGDLALVKPIVHQVQKGTFYQWMKKRGKLGGQNKVPRLANDRAFLDDILDMVATMQIPLKNA